MPEIHDTGSLNYRWSQVLLDALVAGGLARVVASPGSRSTPLTLAAARHPDLDLRMILDERDAAFFALGMARAADEPVALIATSGTAVTEWLPAVTEADLARVPLILLAADRPAELRQCGANQTIDQPGLFGSRARFSMDLPLPDAGLFGAVSRFASRALIAARWPLPGPVHLNIPLREPLTPKAELATPLPRPLRWSRPHIQPDPAQLDSVAAILSDSPGIIVCGPELGAALPVAEIAALAQQLQVPLLADPLSNLRAGDCQERITHYDAILRNVDSAAELRPDWVLRFGAMPISKVLGQFLYSLASAIHIQVDPSGHWTDPLHRCDQLLVAEPVDVARRLCEQVQAIPQAWLARWQAVQQAAARQLAQAPPLEAQVIGTLQQRLPANSLLFSANSLAVRQLDWFLHEHQSPLRILGNRGASGIDGNVATLLGMAAVHCGPVIGLLGDLTLQHDISALAAAQGLNALILVLDNGGGAIFGLLPQTDLDEFEELFLTPGQLDLEPIAKGFGITYHKTSVEELAADLDLALGQSGVRLLHLPIDRELSLRQHQDYWQRLQAMPSQIG